MNFNNGNVNNNNKDNNNRVRFVRVIQVSTQEPHKLFSHNNMKTLSPDKKMKKSDVDMAELYHAYRSCRRRKHRTQQEQEFSIHITTNLPRLRNELLHETYKPMPVRSFLISKPVLREIFAPEFRDRVDQHFIAEKLEPLFEREFINDCYSCRKGRGTLFGIKRLKRFIAQCSANYTKDCFILTGDISGYFMAIGRDTLWQKLETFVRDKYKGDDLEKLLWQTRTFLFSSPLDHTLVRGRRSLWAELPDRKSVFASCGAPKPNEFHGTYTADMDVNQKGLTIGALPAQMLGNFFLTPFDHYCKHHLGLRFYGRYVDDFFVVHTDKEFLKQLIHLLREFLHSLGLELHPNKIRILHYKQGIPFLGAYIKGRVILPGRRIQGGFNHLLRVIDHLPSGIRYDKEVERYVCRLNSYLGKMKHFNARHYIKKQWRKHPRLAWFFKPNGNRTKVTSFYRIRQRQQLYTYRMALLGYHNQFRKRNRHRPFHRKQRFLTSL